MPTPAERIYEAALEGLNEQGERAARFTNAVAPIGAAATAGALLLEPATTRIANAQWPQVVGLIVGSVGILIVLILGAELLLGARIRKVSPELLFPTAATGNETTAVRAEAFHLDAAVDVDVLRESNDLQIKRVGRVFRVFVAALLIELLGLGVAVLTRPAVATPTPVAASLHLTQGELGPRRLLIEGEMSDAARGRVRIVVSLVGRTGRALALHPSIHNGRFRVDVPVPRRVAPLRSATYAINWGGSLSVAREAVSGTIGRCSGSCR